MSTALPPEPRTAHSGVTGWPLRHKIPAGLAAVVALLLAIGSLSPAPKTAKTGTAGPAGTATTLRPAALPLAAGPAATAAVGSLPDRRVTPGSVLRSATVARICVRGYSARARHVSSATRRKVLTAYGIDYPAPTGAYELDHLVALELGGDNSARNLWPERYHGVDSADVKDHLENHLHALVCSGQVRLRTAQRALARDWVAAAATYNPVAVTRTVATPSARSHHGGVAVSSPRRSRTGSSRGPRRSSQLPSRRS